jgi:hypothetical protein
MDNMTILLIKEFCMKRKIIMVIAIITAIIAPLYAQSENDFEVSQNADNTITITGYKGTVKNVVIPSTLYGLKVTIIGNFAFSNKGLTSVTIPDTVITIKDGENYHGTGVFSHNPQLTNVILGKGLKTIGTYAFYKSGLNEIIIPDSVTNIGECSFAGCKLTKVILGNGFQTIDIHSFSGNQITELILPSSLKEIKRHAFYNNKIQKVTFGTGLQIIGDSAFSNNQITELSLPSSLKEIGSNAFDNNQIQSIIIPNTLIANIQYNAFGSTITRITIPARMNDDAIRGLINDTSFFNFWISQNKAGGTYVKRGPIWAKE